MCKHSRILSLSPWRHLTIGATLPKQFKFAAIFPFSFNRIPLCMRRSGAQCSQPLGNGNFSIRKHASNRNLSHATNETGKMWLFASFPIHIYARACVCVCFFAVNFHCCRRRACQAADGPTHVRTWKFYFFCFSHFFPSCLQAIYLSHSHFRFDVHHERNFRWTNIAAAWRANVREPK